MKAPGCPLCDAAGGRVVLQARRWRLVHAPEADFPAFYRLVWETHVKEFSELPADERHECMDTLAAAEQAMLQTFQPVKVNLASLGNAVPHLHWHLVARFDWDSHYPGAVWAPPVREVSVEQLGAIQARLPAFELRLRQALDIAA